MGDRAHGRRWGARPSLPDARLSRVGLNVGPLLPEDGEIDLF